MSNDWVRRIEALEDEVKTLEERNERLAHCVKALSALCDKLWSHVERAAELMKENNNEH